MAKAKLKTEGDALKRCTETPPAFGARDADTVNTAAMAKTNNLEWATVTLSMPKTCQEVLK